MILVLDDYHLIEAHAIHNALTLLLEHLPPQMHLVIATREDPPLPLARLRARQVASFRGIITGYSTTDVPSSQHRGWNKPTQGILAQR